MRDHQQEIENKSAAVAAIGLGGMDYARRFRDEFKITFPLLVDEDSQAHRYATLRKANVLHLLRRDNAGFRKRAKAGGFSQKAPGKDAFQLGGSFIFAPGNRDVFVHSSVTFGDNVPVADLVTVLSLTSG